MSVDCENTLIHKSFMLYFMKENAVHFRDDVGTTFVIAVMFLCRAVSLRSTRCSCKLQRLCS